MIAFNGLVSTTHRQAFLNGYRWLDSPLEQSKLEVMAWLLSVMEGMWGIVQHKVSDLPFEPGWSSFSSFDEYGQSFLERAVKELHGPELSLHLARIASAAFLSPNYVVSANSLVAKLARLATAATKHSEL